MCECFPPHCLTVTFEFIATSLKLKHFEISILYHDCKRSFNYNVFAISVSFLYHVTRRWKWNGLGLPAACAHLLTFSFSCNVYGPLMLLSHTLQRPTQRLHVSVTLSALIRRSRRETVESRGVLFFSGAALLFAVIRDTNSPSVCLFTQYLSVCAAVCDGSWYSADCPGDTLTHTYFSNRHCFCFASLTRNIARSSN